MAAKADPETSETHDTVEADDVEMKDAEGESASEEDVDAEGEEEDIHEGQSSRDLRDMIKELSEYLCSVEEDGQELASGFQRIPNKRILPDYFEVISTPVAFSTVRGKLLRKQYNAFSEFVRDVAQICHNAQVYNRPSAPIFGAAVRLRDIFKGKLKELLDKGLITQADTVLPDLGELPPVEDSPPPPSDIEEDEEDEEEEEDEESEEGDDDSDDEGGRRRNGLGRRGRRSAAARLDREEYTNGNAQKKSTRSLSALTPTEARIDSIIRGLRKFKDQDGSLLASPFERLPDRAQVSDYYQVITNPIALDGIKKNIRRKKYQSVDHAMADFERMFENAKLYNEDDSLLHKAAVELQKQARFLAAQEKQRPDDDFRDEDGRLPLDYVEYKGERWSVGDWVHIHNPNDLAKPVVAQIYRTWQARDNTYWVNVCWYFRPEQTVHRFDKHFFDHEVFKTGQYRDHQIDNVLDRCFVMFIARFNRGRPRGFPRDKSVYVCESQYNEEKFTFNKIKTWASCMPEEVRDRDYEMDMFPAPQNMRKRPSPIKHLLREDAKETDNMPKPTWGGQYAPPIVGAVHRRPRGPNDSPPPEPTPPPHPTHGFSDNISRAPIMHQPGHHPGNMAGMASGPTPFSNPGPLPSPHQYQSHMVPHFQPSTPGAGMPPIHQTPVPVPQMNPHAQSQMPIQSQIHYQQPRYNQPAQSFNQNPAPHIHHQQFQSPMPPQQYQPQTQTYTQPPPTPQSRVIPPVPNAMATGNMYNPPQPPEVYTLPDNINDALPSNVRESFQRDDTGRVLFFTAPPLDRIHRGLSPASAALGHSARYLAGREEWLAEREKKRKARDEDSASANASSSAKQRASSSTAEETKNKVLGEGVVVDQVAKEVVDKYFVELSKDTDRWEKETGLEGWRSAVNG